MPPSLLGCNPVSAFTGSDDSIPVSSKCKKRARHDKAYCKENIVYGWLVKCTMWQSRKAVQNNILSHSFFSKSYLLFKVTVALEPFPVTLDTMGAFRPNGYWDLLRGTTDWEASRELRTISACVCTTSRNAGVT